jgi:hypothetical protein
MNTLGRLLFDFVDGVEGHYVHARLLKNGQVQHRAFQRTQGDLKRVVL